jgi:hypothetical protein
VRGPELIVYMSSISTFGCRVGVKCGFCQFFCAGESKHQDASKIALLPILNELSLAKHFARDED